ncbi:omega-amidase NIT2-A-like [Bombus vancouverensis nearcticus]|uniref:omega-amidase NIT2-A-like n=1 Tax=Bombus vancouverensis nearcticus TaxID=2705178 RepID=UPI00402B404B
MPEIEGDKLYNTCTIWGPDGTLIAKHRKVHLFDIDIPNKITFRESDSLSPGNSLTTFDVKGCKIGIGICYDIRFEEMARIYRNKASEKQDIFETAWVFFPTFLTFNNKIFVKRYNLSNKVLVHSQSRKNIDLLQVLFFTMLRVEFLLDELLLND